MEKVLHGPFTENICLSYRRCTSSFVNGWHRFGRFPSPCFFKLIILVFSASRVSSNLSDVINACAYFCFVGSDLHWRTVISGFRVDIFYRLFVSCWWNNQLKPRLEFQLRSPRLARPFFSFFFKKSITTFRSHNYFSRYSCSYCFSKNPRRFRSHNGQYPHPKSRIPRSSRSGKCQNSSIFTVRSVTKSWQKIGSRRQPRPSYHALWSDPS